MNRELCTKYLKYVNSMLKPIYIYYDYPIYINNITVKMF